MARTSSLDLRSFAEFSPQRLGGHLSEIVAAPNNDDLLTDYPTLRERYGTPEAAEYNVAVRQGLIKNGMGSFAVNAVTFDGQVIGVATVFQSETVPEQGSLIEGPRIAYWLDHRRSEEQRGLGPELLARIALVAAAHHPDMDGIPFTHARPENTPSVRILTDPDNEFGGFEPVGDPRVYDGVGLEVPTTLFVARRSVEELFDASQNHH